MKKTIAGIVFLLLAAMPLAAQQTVVTATVKDPNGIPYANGTVQTSLQISGGPATVTINNQAQCSAASAGTAPCQIPITGNVGPVSIDSTGTFVMTLYSNTSINPASSTWLFTINISPGIPLPLGTGPQTFGVAVTVTGATQNLSSTLSAAAPSLTNFISGGGFPATCPAAISPQILFDNGGVCGSIAGSAVTAATGAVTLTAGAGTTTPLSLVGLGATQTSPLGIFNNASTGTCFAMACFEGYGTGTGAAGFPAATEFMTEANGTQLAYNAWFHTTATPTGKGTGLLANDTGGLDWITELASGALITMEQDSDAAFGSTGAASFLLSGGTGGGHLQGTFTDGSGHNAIISGLQWASGATVVEWDVNNTTGFGMEMFIDGINHNFAFHNPQTNAYSPLIASSVSVANTTGVGVVTTQAPTPPATNYNFNYPTTPGAAGTVLTSQGGGSTPMTWSTFTAFTSITNCGATAACGNTPVSAPRVLIGTAPITTSANETVTGISPAFASSTSYVCTLTEQGSSAFLSSFSASNVSGSSFTIVTMGATFTGNVGYNCTGD